MHRLSSMILTFVLCTQLTVNSAEFKEFQWHATLPPRLSPDGSTFVGARRDNGVRIAYRWNLEDGLIDIELPEDLSGLYTQVSPSAVSADNSIVVGNACTFDHCVPMYWTEEDGVDVLDLPPEFDRGGFHAVSASGDVFVGSLGSGHSNRAFRWTAEGGVQNLGTLPGFNRSAGTFGIDASADGQVIATDLRNWAGSSHPDTTPTEAHIWTEQTGFQSLGTLGGEFTLAQAISADGDVVIGQSGRGIGNTTGSAFRWTADDGMKDLGVLRGRQSSNARDVTGDGSVVVGWSHGSNPDNPPTAFVWDEVNGLRELRTVLEEEHGIDVPRLHWPWSISDDGKAIAGRRQINNETKHAWLVQLDRPIVVTSGVLGDFDGNSLLNVEDLDLLAIELQNERNVPLFDVNGDSLVSFDDRRFWVEDLARTIFGDANLDQEVNFADFLSLSTGFGGEAGWAQGDFDGNGLSEFDDFLILSQNFGKSAAAVQSVPEPTAARLLVNMCLVGMCWRRARAARGDSLEIQRRNLQS